MFWMEADPHRRHDAEVDGAGEMQDGWMDEGMDGWMDGLMDEWMDGWMDIWMHGCMDTWMHGIGWDGIGLDWI